ncbi:Anaerobic dehydrogenase, typically selenocysteine-containing [Pyrobaculum oguniense TE7]|uniref:Anaerobic dehydrogenase, typically selenocysteine-containing n=1 Tax=Pyrobaculum oguniense (strain DSM 13380 / JCM 10595 / TE7) TaxID=698757 RepID=H6Q8K1_PYROT|nr:Anaerobic dehydrogenase, typically selenocysteine-containing [Pyrobaculum oguniense TE7]
MSVALARRDFLKAAASVGALSLGGLFFLKAVSSQQAPIQQASAPASLSPYPQPERWTDVKVAEPWFWHARDKERNLVRSYYLIPTVCNNCEANCSLLAWVDKETFQIRNVTGNPLHPGSLGTTCAKGVASLDQEYSVDRIWFPLKRAKGARRGEMKFERITWEQALKEIGERIRYVYQKFKETGDERWLKTILVQVGRPNEDGVIFRMGRMGGIDGAINHTNQCSSSGRVAALATWGTDRPNSAFHKARLIIMLSDHLDGGHYFQQHAKRIIEGKVDGARIVSLNPRLSNTAAKADVWLPVWPGTDAAVFLAVVHELLKRDAVNWNFVKDWTNWYMLLEDKALLSELADRGFITKAIVDSIPPAEELRKMPEAERFALFKKVLRELYGVWPDNPDHHYTVDWAAAEILGPRELLGVDEATYNAWLSEVKSRILQFVDYVIWAGERIASWTWRSVGAGNLGGVMAQRALYLLHTLTGSIGVEGSVMPAAWHKQPTHELAFNFSTAGGAAPAPNVWNEYTYPPEYPLTVNEVNQLLSVLLLDEEWRKRWENVGFKIPDHLEVYWIANVHTGIRTLPAGLLFAKVLLEGEGADDPHLQPGYSKIRTHIVEDYIWSENAMFADYVLPTGYIFEKSDTVSMETFEGRWTAMRQSVYKRALELSGKLQEALRDWKEPTEEDFKKGTAVPPSLYIHRYVGRGDIVDRDEFWIYLWWYVDPDGSLGIRKYWESKKRPGTPVTIEEMYGAHYDIMQRLYPGGVERLKKFATELGLDPNNEDDLRKAAAEYIKRYGVIFWDGEPQLLKIGGRPQEVNQPVLGKTTYIKPISGDERPNTAVKFSARPVPQQQVARVDPYTRLAYNDKGEVVGIVIGGVESEGTIVGGTVVVGYPTPSRKIEAIYNKTWREFTPKPKGWVVNPYALVIYPRDAKEREEMIHLVSQVHWHYVTKMRGEKGKYFMAGVNIMRNPVHIHARTPNSKYLVELAHKHPVWISPIDAERLGVKTGDLVRVHVVDPFTGLETGWVVYSVFVTDMIRPGTVHTNHHTGRFRLVDFVDVGGARIPVMPFGSNLVDAKRLMDGLSSPQLGVVELKTVKGVLALRPEEVPDRVRTLKTLVPMNEDLRYVWWTSNGATLNWIIPPMTDPISGQNVWNTVVYIEKAQPGDQEGDAYVNLKAIFDVARWWRDNLTWIAEPGRRYPGVDFSPGSTQGKPVRRPYWFPRLNKPAASTYLWPAAGFSLAAFKPGDEEAPPRDLAQELWGAGPSVTGG